MLPVSSWRAAGQAGKVSIEAVVGEVLHPQGSLLSVPPTLPQVTGLLPHLLLPERVGHCPALWQRRSAPRVGPGHP